MSQEDTEATGRQSDEATIRRIREQQQKAIQENPAFSEAVAARYAELANQAAASAPPAPATSEEAQVQANQMFLNSGSHEFAAYGAQRKLAGFDANASNEAVMEQMVEIEVRNQLAKELDAKRDETLKAGQDLPSSKALKAERIQQIKESPEFAQAVELRTNELKQQSTLNETFETSEQAVALADKGFQEKMGHDSSAATAKASLDKMGHKSGTEELQAQLVEMEARKSLSDALDHRRYNEIENGINNAPSEARLKAERIQQVKESPEFAQAVELRTNELKQQSTLNETFETSEQALALADKGFQEKMGHDSSAATAKASLDKMGHKSSTEELQSQLVEMEARQSVSDALDHRRRNEIENGINNAPSEAKLKAERIQQVKESPEFAQAVELRTKELKQQSTLNETFETSEQALALADKGNQEKNGHDWNASMASRAVEKMDYKASTEELQTHLVEMEARKNLSNALDHRRRNEIENKLNPPAQAQSAQQAQGVDSTKAEVATTQQATEHLQEGSHEQKVQAFLADLKSNHKPRSDATPEFYIKMQESWIDQAHRNLRSRGDESAKVEIEAREQFIEHLKDGMHDHKVQSFLADLKSNHNPRSDATPEFYVKMQEGLIDEAKQNLYARGDESAKVEIEAREQFIEHLQSQMDNSQSQSAEQGSQQNIRDSVDQKGVGLAGALRESMGQPATLAAQEQQNQNQQATQSSRSGMSMS